MPYYSPYFPYLILPVVLAGLYFLFENYLSKPWMRWLWWIGCILLLVVVGWYASQDQYWYDFYKGYYHAGRKILRNQDVLYDEYCYGFTNFPLVAYLFVPFGRLSKEIAGTLFFLIGYISILPLAYWLVKFPNLKGRSRWLILALLAVNGPLDYSIWLGNITHILMLSTLILLWHFKQGREWLTGILLGINGAVKIPLILPALYFFTRRQWRVVGGGLVVVGVITGLSLLFVPFSLNDTWINRCILSIAGNPIAAYNNQSVLGFLAREFMPGNLGWDPLSPTLEFKWTSNIALLLLFIPIFIILFLGQKPSSNSPKFILEFFIFLSCSLLTSPISWTHYYMLLLLPAAYYLSDAGLKSHQVWINILFGASLILISSPVKVALALFQQTDQRLFLSLHFIGGVLFYIFLLIIWVGKVRFFQPKNPDIKSVFDDKQTEAK